MANRDPEVTRQLRRRVAFATQNVLLPANLESATASYLPAAIQSAAVPPLLVRPSHACTLSILRMFELARPIRIGLRELRYLCTYLRLNE